MISEKNFTPKQLAALTAVLLSVPIAIVIFIFKPVWWVALLSTAVIFVGSYLLFLKMLQVFIYRKIKLIYKLISHTKASKKEEFYYKNLLPQQTIDEVRQDVEKWAEEKKLEIETLKQNEVFRKEFLQNLSHELKTPIFAMQGYIDTLLNGALYDKDNNISFLQKAGRNAERLVGLTRDLDEISKLESGQVNIAAENFVIQDLVKEVFDSLYLKAKDRGIALVIKKGCEAPLMVSADREKIRQVLINLIDNAIKYGKDNGIVEASFYKVEDKKILIEISDNGVGITEDHLPRVFERFYRTELARTRKVGGSGLGLAICKHIIEAHDQTIHVRSKKDVGTTIGFTLEEK